MKDRKQNSMRRRNINGYEIAVIALFVVVSFAIAVNFNNSTILKPLFASVIISIVFVFVVITGKSIIHSNVLFFGVIAFFLWNLISALYSPFLYHSLLRLNYLFFGLLLFLIIISQSNWKNDWFAKGMLSIALLQSIYAILQRFGYSPFAWDAAARMSHLQRFVDFSNFRVYAAFGHPNYLASFLAFNLPILFYLIAKRKRDAWFVIALISLPIILVALVLTLSRGGWIAGIVGIIVFVAFYFRKWNIQRKWLWIMLGGFILFVILLAVLMPDIFLQRVVSLTDPKKAIGLGRRNIWSGTWQMIKERPIFGWGTGSFSQIFPEFRPSDYKLFAEDIVKHAHNEFMEIFAETGIIGLILFLLVLISFVRNALHLKNRKNMAFVALFSGVCGILVHNLVSLSLRTPTIHFLFWALLACSLPNLNQTKKFKLKPKFKWIFLIIFTPIMLIFIALNLTSAISDYHLGKGRNYKAKADAYKSQQLFKKWKNYLNMAEERYLTAIKYNKSNTSAFYRLGVLYLDRDDYGKAIEIYESLLDYSPYYPEAHKNLGIAYSEMGETETGIDHLKRSLERIEDADTYFALGRLYERIAEFDSMMYYQEKFLPKAAQELSRIKNLEGYAGYKKVEMQTLSSQFNDIFERLEENYSLYNSWERAIEPYSKIVELVPDEALFRFHLGVAYRHTQDCGRAIEELKKSLKLAHGKRYYRLIIMQTFDNLADCYFILDTPELAKDALQKLITINPQSPLAEKARKRLAEME